VRWENIFLCQKRKKEEKKKEKRGKKGRRKEAKRRKETERGTFLWRFRCGINQRSTRWRRIDYKTRGRTGWKVFELL